MNAQPDSTQPVEPAAYGNCEMCSTEPVSMIAITVEDMTATAFCTPCFVATIAQMAAAQEKGGSQ